ncbi:MAG: DUF4403 family protein [Bacteroidota bacterium]
MHWHIRLPLPLLEQVAQDQLAIFLREHADVPQLGGGIRGLHLTPLQALTLEGAEDHILSRIRLQVQAKIRTEGLGVRSLLRSFSPWEEVWFVVDLQLRTYFSLRPDWSVQISSRFAYTWHKKPGLGVGPLTVPLSAVVGPMLEGELQSVAQQIDEQIHSFLQAETWARLGWEATHQAWPLPGSWPSWLQAFPAPEELTLSTFSLSKTALQLGVKAEAEADLWIGEAPEEQEVSPLPRWELGEDPSGDTHIKLAAHLPLHWVEQTLQQAHIPLLAPPLTASWQVQHISWQADHLKIQVQARGLWGRKRIGYPLRTGLRITCQPRLEAGNRHFFLDELKVELVDASFATKLVAKRVRSLLLNRVEEAFNAWFWGEWEQIVADTRKSIAGLLLLPELRLNAHLSELIPEELTFSEQEVRLTMTAIGKAELEVAQLKPAE